MSRTPLVAYTNATRSFSATRRLTLSKTACNGNIVEDNGEQVIQLQGDQRKPLITFLTRKDTAKEPGLELDPSLIQEHGF